MPLVNINDDHGQTVGTIGMMATTFSTGSRGFRGYGKVELAGKRYQINFLLIEIGSKPGSKVGQQTQAKTKARGARK